MAGSAIPALRAPSGRGQESLTFLVAAAASAALLLWAIGNLLFSSLFLAGLLAAAGLILLFQRRGPAAAIIDQGPAGQLDISLLRTILDGAGPDLALALTDKTGTLFTANAAWCDWLGGGVSPADLVDDEGGRSRLDQLARDAIRQGRSTTDRVTLGRHIFRAEIDLVGDQLLWRLIRDDPGDLNPKRRDSSPPRPASGSATQASCWSWPIMRGEFTPPIPPSRSGPRARMAIPSPSANLSTFSPPPRRVPFIFRRN